jgi:hypothetical protein
MDEYDQPVDCILSVATNQVDAESYSRMEPKLRDNGIVNQLDSAFSMILLGLT